MSFGNDLKKEIKVALGELKPSEINPLITIGLTDSILNLGLNNEQLYLIVRSYVRQLVAQIHPDRTGRKPTLDEEAFLTAFNVLDDHERFSEALSEFKNLRADERHEIRLLRQAIEALRLQIKQHEKRAKTFQEMKAEVENERAIFMEEKAKEPLIVPDLLIQMKFLSKKIQDFERYRKKDQDDLRDQRFVTNTFERFLAALNHQHFNLNGVFAPSIIDAGAAIVFTLRLGKNMSLLPFGKNKMVTRDFCRAANAVGAGQETLRVIKKQLKILVHSSKLYRGRAMIGASLFKPSIEIYTIQNAKVNAIIYPKNGLNEPIIGRTILGSIGPGKFQLTSETYHRSQTKRIVLEETLPVLEKDGLMVLSPKSKPEISKMSVGQLKQALLDNAKRFQTTKYIMFAK